MRPLHTGLTLAQKFDKALRDYRLLTTQIHRSEQYIAYLEVEVAKIETTLKEEFQLGKGLLK
jgi:hypothetical protein